MSIGTDLLPEIDQEMAPTRRVLERASGYSFEKTEALRCSSLPRAL